MDIDVMDTNDTTPIQNTNEKIKKTGSKHYSLV